MSELQVDDLRLSYDGKSYAVDGLTFTAPEGKITTLLGPSGCGKTSTLRCVAGLEDPTAGEISIGGRRVVGSTTYVPAQRRDINMVFQSYATWPHLTVFENVAYGLRVKRVASSVVRERVGQALDLVGLSAYAERHPGQLSGGQQQRVAVARAVVTDPGLILFDEPLSNLDAALRVRMRKELVELQRELGKTSLYVTHDQSEAMAMSDQTILLSEGKLVQAGPPEEIYQRPINRMVAEFMGAANVVTGDVADARGETITIDHQGARVTGLRRDHDTLEGLTVCAVIRPEVVSIEHGGGDVQENRWRGTVVAREYLGAGYSYDVECGLGVINVLGGELKADLGDTVTIGVPVESVLVVKA